MVLLMEIAYWAVKWERRSMSEQVLRQICKDAEALVRDLRTLRQDFHKYAESGWLEIRTASIIAARLKELGYQILTGREVCLAEERIGVPDAKVLEAEYRRALSQGAVQPYAEQLKDGFTGVIGVLNCGEGPVVGMRFDIDALKVSEAEDESHRPRREGFSSVNEGTMHACGHDAHAAIGLGVAELLMKYRSQLRGTIKLIFQPAEEGLRGAKSIVEKGHLDDVEYLFCTHVAGKKQDTKIGLTTSANMASVKMDICFRGKASHAGSAPERGNNAMLAAATAVLNLHAIPRCSMGETRLNVGTLHAGTSRNVICDCAKLELEVRGSTNEASRFTVEYAERIANAAADMHGCACEIQMVGGTESFRSSPELIERCKQLCEEELHLPVSMADRDAGGCEDYSFMVNLVQSRGGQALRFYTRTQIGGSAHSSTFDLQEEDLVNGVKVLCCLALQVQQEP